MEIGVVGGGAIGLLTAGYLSEKFPVTLYVRRLEQKRLLEMHGLSIVGYRETINRLSIQLSATPWREDVVIIAVKQPDLPMLMAEHNKAQVPDQALLFLQNGASHIELLDKLDYPHLFIGIVEHGVYKQSDHSVVLRGMGEIKVGIYKGNADRLAPLLNLITFPFKLADDWQSNLSDKLMVNAIINPLTALYRVPNGALVSNPFYYQIMRKVFKEVTLVLETPDPDVAFEHVTSVCRNTASNRSSMLQDIEKGNKTEIDAILGELLKKGRMKAVCLPLLSFLYQSIKAQEIDRREVGEDD